MGKNSYLCSGGSSKEDAEAVIAVPPTTAKKNVQLSQATRFFV
jgi:hypothetical protein